MLSVCVCHDCAPLSLVPGQGGAGHRPSPFPVVPEASRVCCKRVSRPRVPPGLIVGQTVEHQMFNCFFGALTVWADGQVLAPDTVQVSCCQWKMASAYLCHHDALVFGPIPLPTLVAVLTMNAPLAEHVDGSMHCVQMGVKKDP